MFLESTSPFTVPYIPHISDFAMYECDTLYKLLPKIAILTRTYDGLTVASLVFIFVFHWAGIRRATYLCLERLQKLEYNSSFIIRVNFDHVWE